MNIAIYKRKKSVKLIFIQYQKKVLRHQQHLFEFITDSCKWTDVN